MLEIAGALLVIGLFGLYRHTKIILDRNRQEAERKKAELDMAKDRQDHQHYMEVRALDAPQTPELLAVRLEEAKARSAEAQAKAAATQLEQDARDYSNSIKELHRRYARK